MTVDSIATQLTFLFTPLRLGLAAFFLFLSYKAISGDASVVQDFERWGYPGTFRVFTGACQAFGAIALAVPQTSLWGAGILLIVLAGATLTHLLHDPWTSLASPLIVLALVLLATLPGAQEALR